MAITHVAHDATKNGASSPIVITVATSAGNLAVVWVEWVPTTSTASVSGNVSGAYTASSVGKLTNGTTVAAEMFYKQNAGADTSITVTVGSATSINATYCEFAGAALSGGEDGTASGTGTSTSPVTSGSLTSVGTTDVIVAGGAISIGTDTWTAGSGFTLTTGLARAQQEFQIFTSAINQTVGYTLSSTSTAWIVSASAFQAAGGAAPILYTIPLLGAGPA